MHGRATTTIEVIGLQPATRQFATLKKIAESKGTESPDPSDVIGVLDRRSDPRQWGRSGNRPKRRVKEPVLDRQLLTTG
ncbi:MAG: hypothetical protein ACK5PB_16845 [Pirellula sp.]